MYKKMHQNPVSGAVWIRRSSRHMSRQFREEKCLVLLWTEAFLDQYIPIDDTVEASWRV